MPETGSAAEELLEIYERERGELPPAGALTDERRRKCAHWLAGGFTAEEFRAAVRSAAATPFLAGEGNRGWQASFDWLIANRTNARKVLEGEYAPHARSRAGKIRAERRLPADLYAGIGPRAADCGVRVNPAALERIRAREARSQRLAQAAAFAAPQKTAPGEPLQAASHATSYPGSPRASDAASACNGIPPKGVAIAAVDRAASAPIAFDAPARASPPLLKS